MVRAELRANAGRCYGCGASLAAAHLVRRSWRKIRSGDWIGSRGEYVTLVCVCGRRIRLMRAVNMSEA